MFEAKQFKEHILIPALTALQLDSPQAQTLMLGTLATESLGGTYLVQEHGPALGIFQMEPETHAYLWRFLVLHPLVIHRLLKFCKFSSRPQAQDMIGNLYYATCMARIKYYTIKHPIPKSLTEIAAYYKQFYNTPEGSNTPEKFIEDYNKFVGV